MKSLSLLLVIILSGIFIGCSKHASKTESVDNNKDSTFVNDTPDTILSTQETIADNQPKEEAPYKTYDSYEDVLNGLDTSLEYFYYDITRDGKPELWVKAGTCEADMKLYIFTMDKKVHKIFETSGFHSSFYAGKDYVIRQVTDTASNTWYKIKYKNGRVQETVCFHREVNMDSDEDIDIQDERVYKTPPEKPIKTIDF